MAPARLSSVWTVIGSCACLALIALSFLSYRLFYREKPRPAEYVRLLTTGAGYLTSVRYSPDGDHLAAGSASGLVLLWNLEFGAPARRIQVSKQPIITITASQDGFFMAADAARGLFGWEAGEESQLQDFGVLSAAAVAIAFRPSKEREIVLGLSDGSIKSLTKSGIVKLASEHRGSVKSIVFHPDGRAMVSGGEDGKLIWYDLETRKAESVVEAHDGELSELLFSSDGGKLASADWNGGIKVWDAQSRSLLAEMSQPAAVCGIGWAGDYLVTGSWDGVIRNWSVAQQNLVRQVDTGQATIDLAMRPDGGQLVTVSNSGDVEFWRIPLP